MLPLSVYLLLTVFVGHAVAYQVSRWIWQQVKAISIVVGVTVAITDY